MNKQILNQIATYSDINCFLSFSRSESRAGDTYGYPIIKITHSGTGKVYRSLGAGYDCHGTNLGHYIMDTVREVPQALEALADGVYKEIQAGEGIPYGLFLRNREKVQKDGKYIASKVRKAIREGDYYLDGGCGDSCMKRIAKLIGIKIVDQYQRAATRRGTDKFLGCKVELIPEGLLVKLMAKAKKQESEN